MVPMVQATNNFILTYSLENMEIKRKSELYVANESKFKIPATKFLLQMLSKKLGSCLVVSTGMRYMMWQCK